MREFLKKILPGILILAFLSYLYYFKIAPPPKDLKERYMISYCRYLCKKAIIEGKVGKGVVLSEIYKEVQVPVGIGDGLKNKTLSWDWDYACCVGDCDYEKKIILDENCTFIKMVG